MRFVSQQLSPILRRVRAVPDPPEGDRLPDPALGDWGRAQLAAEPLVEHPSLAAAVSGTGVDVRTLDVGQGGAVRLRISLAPAEHLWGAFDADARSMTLDRG